MVVMNPGCPLDLTGMLWKNGLKGPTFRNPGLTGIKAIGICNLKKQQQQLLIAPDSQLEIADRGEWQPQRGSEQNDMKKALCWDA